MSNDIETGTVTGIIVKGTGPAGYTMILTFAPDIALSTEKYPAPIVTDQGTWELTITDPVKAGFYKLSAIGRKDSIVSPDSPTVAFEVSVLDGGQVRLVSNDDKTAAYQQAQATRVAAATARKKVIWGGSATVVLVAALALATIFRRKLFSGFNRLLS